MKKLINSNNPSRNCMNHMEEVVAVVVVVVVEAVVAVAVVGGGAVGYSVRVQ